jgi:hypothetical protein
MGPVSNEEQASIGVLAARLEVLSMEQADLDTRLVALLKPLINGPLDVAAN